MLDACHSAEDVADLYRTTFRWPVHVFAGRPYLVTDTVIGAVTMPARIGWLVRQTLHNSVSVPVVTFPQAQRQWIFLVSAWCGPAPDYRVRILRDHGVTIVRAGVRVWLPVSDSAIGWHWASAPLPWQRRLPRRSLVLNRAKRVLDIGPLWQRQECGGD